jgi:ribonuclease D
VPAPRPIQDDAALAELVRTLVDQPAYALDTEFHRERTYFPKVALLQLAWDGGLALVDPLAVSLEPLAEVLDGPGTAVLHAADQDLEVLQLACGTVPSTLYDTQVAAGFLGMSTPSLAAVYDRWMGIRLPKGERLTDWLARPLGERQLSYAASDVVHLLEVRDQQVAELDERGRREWAATECELLRVRGRGGRDPEQAWRRIKEARQLKGRTAAVARAVAAWRERRAAEVDRPPRFVLADLAVVTIAQRAPATLDELAGIRGVDERQARGRMGEELLAAVRRGVEAPLERDPAEPRELDRELRPAVGLVSSWVSQLARDLDLDTTLLATRADIEDLLRGDPGARLTEGWRAELVGDPVRALVSGEAALAFDGKGGLLLEARSHTPLE